MYGLHWSAVDIIITFRINKLFNVGMCKEIILM